MIKRLIVIITMWFPIALMSELINVNINEGIHYIEAEQANKAKLIRLIQRPEMFEVKTGGVVLVSSNTENAVFDLSILEIKPSGLWYSDIEMVLRQNEEPVIYEYPSITKRVIGAAMRFIPITAAGLAYGRALSNKIDPEKRSDVCIEINKEELIRCYENQGIMETIRLVKPNIVIYEESGNQRKSKLSSAGFSLIDQYTSDVPWDGPYMTKRSDFLLIRPNLVNKNLRLVLTKTMESKGSVLNEEISFERF